MNPFLPAEWLPVIFAGLMGISILLYVILDGLDLGIGILSLGQSNEHRDSMISSIGPFWDANETWLVLAIGLLLVAFPLAHGIILTALYLPVALMLIGLILRGVAFEFRVKAPAHKKPRWNFLFFAGSLLASLTQGWMLGAYILGFENGLIPTLFSLLTAICLTAGYAFMGACWLIHKSTGVLQRKAIHWAEITLLAVGVGFAAISIASPLASPRVFERWFELPQLLWLAPLPVLAGGIFLWLWSFLRKLPLPQDRLNWLPLAAAALLFTLAFLGLAYSFFPYIVPDRLTLAQAASAPEALSIILIGTLFVLPVILAYSVLAHWVFRGKATELTYH
ncbi:cytochrome d ubiquinol oxidase subunit II [Sandaracinobacteroides hominis]|uniref:cytochrome d ubiquinol oxidase subunit II n=1 Tax=Sandaracinobacteroides hominis TaxID=2780086 RepID=UPI0018F3C92A|nr:cytochrome d ubiquinol oxidase subunit II [Sandaracinobacteroides hominis]